MESHYFDDKYIDVPIKGKDKEWKNYRVTGEVTYSVWNDSFSYEYGSIKGTHQLPDYIEDLDTDKLKIVDMSDPNIEEIILGECPEDLKEYMEDNLFDLMKFSITT